MGSPPGLAAVFTISGGTALMMRRLCHAALAVPRQIVHHLAAAGGMADMHRILQIEMRGQRRQVVGIVIHVMAIAGLGGAAMAAPVMGDDAIA